MTEEKELQPVDIEWEAEKICRWGAARAGVIVVAPLVGTMAFCLLYTSPSPRDA